MSNIIHLPNAVKVYGADPNVVVETCWVTPEQAATWLEANKHNRPVRRRHVAFLASEIIAGNWQVNGQAIIIADDEQVLDGQHRLLAIIEAGKPIQTFVVYGIKASAFRTIDTGAVRTGADALALHFPEMQIGIIKSAATAAQWCVKLEEGYLSKSIRTSNTDVIEYLITHSTLFQLAATLHSYPKDSRPLSLGIGLSLYEIFYRKKAALADEFMRRLYVGEGLDRTEPEYLLRMRFYKDSQQVSRMPIANKVRMVIKGWNLRRRGINKTNTQALTLRADDPQKVVIL